MKQVALIGSLVVILSLVTLSRECRAAPKIDQNPGSPISYQITDVSDQDHPSTYDIVLMDIPGAFQPPYLPFPSFTIKRDPNLPNESITIRKLTIPRPEENGAGLGVTIGLSNQRLKAVGEIVVGPRIDGQREGYVAVYAHLDGGSGITALGEVDGPNYLHATIFTGNVVGPITCVMHPNAEPGTDPDYYLSGLGLKLESGGAMLADLTVHSWQEEPAILGNIIEVNVPSGVIGAINDKAQVKADGVIHNVIAKEIHAMMSGTSDDPNDPLFDSYTDVIGYINARVVSGSGGLFTGEVRGEELGDIYGLTGLTLGLGQNMKIEGEMQGRIFLQRIAAGNYGISITSSTPRLRGTILLGCRDAGEGASAWGSDVEVHADGSTNPPQIVLDADDVAGYDPQRLSSTLGGGAATMMPVRLHSYDCKPAFVASGETIADPDELGNTIEMRQFGPVNWNAGDGQPYQVERRKTGSTSEYDWQVQDCFTCTLDNYGTVVKVTSSSATIQRGFQYRISQRKRGDQTNVLRCDLPHLSAGGGPEVVDHAPLTFTVCNEVFFPSAPGDADDSGLVDQNDVDSVLANWGSTACMKYGDADRNGVVNSVDLEVAEAYLAWEYCYEAPQGFMKVADGFAQMDLDGDPAAMSAPMTVTEAVVAMGYDDIEDFGASFEAMEAPARAAARAVLMALISGG